MMRQPHLAYALPLLLLAAATALPACTTKRVIVDNGAGSPGAGPGSDDVDGSAPETCVPSDDAVIFSETVLGKPSIDLAASRLGFGYIDAEGVPTVQAHDVVSSESWKAQWSPAVVHERYGLQNLHTSLAHNGETFGFGWYTEAPRKTVDNVSSTRFSTVSASTGEQTAAVKGNDDYGRADADDYVQATRPVVLPAGEGFLMAWQDRRTKEPIELNINVSGWSGIYARSYDASGEPAAQDVQIAQPAGFHSIKAIDDGSNVTAIWTQLTGAFEATVHARTGATFTPAETPPAVAEFSSQKAPRLAAAVGHDGNVLVVVERWPEYDRTTLGGLSLKPSGAKGSAYADWDDSEGLLQPALAATKDGYVLAAYELTNGEYTAIRLFWLDGAGKRLRETRSKLSLPAGTRLGELSVQVQGSSIHVAFVTEAEALFDPFDAQVHALTVCDAPNG